MLDKVELRVPGQTPFRPEFQWIEKEIPYAGQCSLIRRSVHYQGGVNLRPFGLDAMLHAYFKRVLRGPHKLELLRTGRKSLKEMAGIVTALFNVDPSDLGIMRLDFAADLQGIPLDYLHSCLRVKFKRTSTERGELDYENIGKKRLEYFRYGTKPNCVRVYDKVIECKARLPELEILLRATGVPVTFEEAFGFSPDATLSRVERQAGGGRVPAQLSTFHNLHQADTFDPFTNVEIVPDALIIPDPKRYGESGALKLLGLRSLIDQYGLQNARAMLNGNGNAKRYLDAYSKYAKQCESEYHVSADTLFAAYRDSVRKQINGTISSPQCGGHDDCSVSKSVAITNAVPNIQYRSDMRGAQAN